MLDVISAGGGGCGETRPGRGVPQEEGSLQILNQVPRTQRTDVWNLNADEGRGWGTAGTSPAVWSQGTASTRAHAYAAVKQASLKQA